MSRQKREWLERLETLTRKVIDEWHATDEHGGCLYRFEEALDQLEWEMDHR